MPAAAASAAAVEWASPVVVSQPIPGGHVVAVHPSAGAEVVVRFADDGSVREVTAWAADLALVGLVATSQPGPDAPDTPFGGGPPDGAPTAPPVRVAEVSLTGPVSALYLHPASSSGSWISPEFLVELVAAGAGRAIAAGVRLDPDAGPDVGPAVSGTDGEPPA